MAKADSHLVFARRDLMTLMFANQGALRADGNLVRLAKVLDRTIAVKLTRRRHHRLTATGTTDWPANRA